MSKAKFEAFKTALAALCEEHQVTFHSCYDGDIYVDDAGEEPIDLECLFDGTRRSPEEQAAFEAEQKAAHERREQEHRDRVEKWSRLHGETLAAMQEVSKYVVDADLWNALAAAQAQHQRKEDMRVSTDPTDPAYIDARPRKAWCNDIEIEGWVVADEFRRVVITPEKVHNGSVRVERLPEWVPAPEMLDAWVGITKEFEAAIAPPIEWPQIEEAAPLPPITSLPRVKQETRPAKRRR